MSKKNLPVKTRRDLIKETSGYEQFKERIVDSSKFLYSCHNVNTSYKLVGLNVCTPT